MPNKQTYIVIPLLTNRSFTVTVHLTMARSPSEVDEVNAGVADVTGRDLLIEIRPVINRLSISSPKGELRRDHVAQPLSVTSRLRFADLNIELRQYFFVAAALRKFSSSPVGFGNVGSSANRTRSRSERY